MFKSRLILEPSKVEGRFSLVEPLIFESKTLGKIIVPRGFDTDGASIPLFFNEVWKIGGVKMAPAVLHDYLYRTQICTRQEADKVFLEAMECAGVSKFKRTSMYYAVRTFGWLAWSKNRGAV